MEKQIVNPNKTGFELKIKEWLNPDVILKTIINKDFLRGFHGRYR